MSAAAMAPGGAAAGGGGGGGGSSGGVLHFVGSRCGELGTNSNQREAQQGVHLRRPCTAPGGKRSPGPPWQRRGVGRRAPGLATAAGRREPSCPPALCQNGGCALPLRGAVPPLRPWHLHPLGRGPGEPAPLCPISSSFPAQKREEEGASTRPCPLQPGSIRVKHAARCPPERASCGAEETGSSCRRHFHGAAGASRGTGPGNRRRSEPSDGAPVAKGRASPSLPLVCSVNNFHVWERRGIVYLLLSQQYI